MEPTLNRRQLLGAAATATAVLGLSTTASAVFGANRKLVVGVMGMGGRGRSVAATFAQQPDVEIAYVCDVDMKRAESAVGAVSGKSAGKTPKAVQDFRRILDDKDVDILVVTTSNHWHAPATILGCGAGKHVYVEKPCSHNPREGELMVEAARKYRRQVQMGNQRRSWPKVMEAIERVRSGVLGEVYFAQAYYTNNRDGIGKGKSAPVPEGLDYALWQGPAPRKPFRDNYLHYNWHWFWHWGNGELGNNGVHTIDVCRWGLGVDLPVHVTSSGGRFRFDDDQETPDTNVVSYTYADGKMITWDGLSCSRFPNGQPADVIFHGEKGTLAIRGGGYTISDPSGKEVEKVAGGYNDVTHVANFLDGIRGGTPLRSEIREGHISTLLCHLGNIAYRTGRALKCDPKTGKILNDREAMTYWSREYARGFEPKV